MESRKTIIIIDIDTKRTEKTFYKLKEAGVQVKVAKNKRTIDEIKRSGGISALLIAPQVAGDIERLRELYHAPIFIVGDIEPHQLAVLYKKDIVDLLPSDFDIRLLFDRLGEDYQLPTTTRVSSSVLIEDNFEEDDAVPKRSKVQKERNRSKGNKESNKSKDKPKEQPKQKLKKTHTEIPKVTYDDEFEEGYEENDDFEAVTSPKKKSILSVFTQPISFKKRG